MGHIFSTADIRISLLIFKIILLGNYNEEEESKYSEPPNGFCAPYNGKICKGHKIGQYWFNATEGNAGGLINEQIATMLWDEIILGLEEPCRSAAEVYWSSIPN